MSERFNIRKGKTKAYYIPRGARAGSRVQIAGDKGKCEGARVRRPASSAPTTRLSHLRISALNLTKAFASTRIRMESVEGQLASSFLGQTEFRARRWVVAASRKSFSHSYNVQRLVISLSFPNNRCFHGLFSLTG